MENEKEGVEEQLAELPVIELKLNPFDIGVKFKDDGSVEFIYASEEVQQIVEFNTKRYGTFLIKMDIMSAGVEMYALRGDFTANIPE